MLSQVERDRRARQRNASLALNEQRRRDRVMRMTEMMATSGLSRWTITRAAARGELRLIKMSARAVGCRETEFWRWIDNKSV